MAATLTTTVIVAALFMTLLTGGIGQSPAAAPSPSFEAAPPPLMAEAPSPSFEAVPPPFMEEAPSPAPDCMTALYNLSDCLTFVEEGSNQTKPDPGCCPELAGLVDSQPICLCLLLGNTESFGFKIDKSKSLKLPSVCGVTTPPVSMCAVAGYPVRGLSPAPSEGPGGMPPEGLSANPASGNRNNGASTISFSHLSFFAGLAIAFLTSLVF